MKDMKISLNTAFLTMVSLWLCIKNVGNNVGNNVIKKDTKKKSAQDRRQNILGLMIDDSKITIPQLSKKLNVSTKTIERDIEKLKEENKIYRQGNSRDGTWIVLEWKNPYIHL